jgi:hypothetical protein
MVGNSEEMLKVLVNGVTFHVGTQGVEDLSRPLICRTIAVYGLA